MIKFLSIFFLLYTISYAKDYPIIYAKMANPLYDSVEKLSKLSTIDDIKTTTIKYSKLIDDTKKYGYRVDKKEQSYTPSEYLKKLRLLQKEYDYILHILHENIDNAIDKKDYDLFIKLTSSDFEGLLQNTALLNKSLAYYKKQSSKKKCKILEQKIEFKKNLYVAPPEDYNIVETATFDSNKKRKISNSSVALYAKRVGNTVIVSIENKNIYSVTVSVKAKYKNISYDTNVANVFALKPKSKKEYLRLNLKLGQGKASYQFSYSWIIGSMDAVHNDSYVYGLPYSKGSSFIIAQGYNGKSSHKGKSAIDFAMKIGTRICASRDGVVIKTKSNSNKGGGSRKFSKYGNFVMIEHSDNTVATYYHLKHRGVVVRAGQKVLKGQGIGYSGNTGYSTGPHLHFAVFKTTNKKTTQTLPVKFGTTSGILDRLKKGKYYKAK